MSLSNWKGGAKCLPSTGTVSSRLVLCIAPSNCVSISDSRSSMLTHAVSGDSSGKTTSAVGSCYRSKHSENCRQRRRPLLRGKESRRTPTDL